MAAYTKETAQFYKTSVTIGHGGSPGIIRETVFPILEFIAVRSVGKKSLVTAAIRSRRKIIINTVSNKQSHGS